MAARRSTARRSTAERGKAGRLERLRVLCAAHGLPLTEPRRVILEAVFDLETHPTADEVYALAVKRRRGIARATVYRTLETFVRLGIISKASHAGPAVRYDPTVDRHHHCVCMRCDRVMDIRDERLDTLPVPDTSRMGFRVSDVQVQLLGLCRTCLSEEDKP